MNIYLFKKIKNDLVDYLIGSNKFLYIPDSINKILYPVDISFTLKDTKHYYYPLDNEGLPYKVYDSVGKQYNPTRIAAYGLSHFNEYIKNNSENHKELFFKALHWFYSKEDALYEYAFNWNELKAPWISCMAQGEAASILIRGFLLTSEQKYLDHARKALQPMLETIHMGGVYSEIDNEFPFLEEYPLNNPDHVLNGFLYALIGIIEYTTVTNDQIMVDLQRKLLKSLFENLYRWNSGRWSYYQLSKRKEIIKNFTTPNYHNLHISQLKYLISYEYDNKVACIIKEWEKGSKSFFNRFEAMINKVLYRTINKAQR